MALAAGPSPMMPCRLERLQIAQPLGPVEVARARRRSFQRPLGAAEHRHLLAAGDLAHDAGVALGQVGGDVAADGGDGQQLQLGAAKARNSATASSTPGSQSMIRD
jgi:hypothetical protein